MSTYENQGLRLTTTLEEFSEEIFRYSKTTGNGTIEHPICMRVEEQHAASLDWITDTEEFPDGPARRVLIAYRINTGANYDNGIDEISFVGMFEESSPEFGHPGIFSPHSIRNSANILELSLRETDRLMDVTGTAINVDIDVRQPDKVDEYTRRWVLSSNIELREKLYNRTTPTTIRRGRPLAFNSAYDVEYQGIINLLNALKPRQ